MFVVYEYLYVLSFNTHLYLPFMKQILILSLLLLSSLLHLHAQENLQPLIDEAKFDKADKKIQKTLEKNPNDVCAHYFSAILYANKSYPNYNLDSANANIQYAEKVFKKLKDKDEKAGLKKLAIDKKAFTKVKTLIAQSALDEAMLVNDVAAYNSYLERFATAPEKFTNRAVVKRDSILFARALNQNSADIYMGFINDYPKSKQVEKAWEQLSLLAIVQAKDDGKMLNYSDFELFYPAAKLNPRVISIFSREQLLQSNNWQDYLAYIKKNPNDSKKAQIQDSLLAMGLRTNNVILLRYCADNLPVEKRKDAIAAYYNIVRFDGEQSSIMSFFRKYNEPTVVALKDADMKLAQQSELLLLHMPYSSTDSVRYDAYVRAAAPNEKSFLALQRILSPYINKQDWKAAISILSKYQSLYPSNDKRIINLMRVLQADVDPTVKVYSLGEGVNLKKGQQYVPVVTADDKTIYFCGKKRVDNIGGEDIFYSNFENGKWQASKIIMELSKPTSNDAPMSVSADGTTLLVFKSGKIFYSDKTDTAWTDIKAFPRQINAARWQSDAIITSDGKHLLFASTRVGGYNNDTVWHFYHGGNQYPSDMYVSHLNDKKEWGEPENLGPIVNTPFCDRNPFLHADMKTLYFSSDGHGGLGSLDVYKSTRLRDDCWDCWSEPVNLGKEINTEETDWGYTISTNGEKAYFTKRDPLMKGDTIENERIYYVSLPTESRPNQVVTLSGRLVDAKGKAVSAEIYWEDLITGERIGQSKSDPKDGSYFVVLPLGKMYGYYVESNKYFPISNNVDLRAESKAKLLQHDISISSFEDMIASGKPVPINNLFFDFNQSTLLPYSIPELKRVAQIIIKTKMKVEISGHTDNVGDAAKNQLLSEQRASSVRDFLIAEGCPAQLLSIKGYGATQPTVPNTTPENRAKNRRVELRFVK